MSMGQQTQVLDEWRDSAPFWEKHAQTIRLMFAPVTQALMEDARIGRGSNVLDVAGGPGEPSLTIAEFVGPSGIVTCTDPVAAMVAAAERAAQRRGVTNVRFRQCVAESLPFEDYQFDAVVSRLGVMFFPDPVAGLREMLRVTKAKGRLSLAVWGKREENPFTYIVSNVISQYFAPAPPIEGALDAFRFAEKGSLAEVLSTAGARSVTERVFDFHIEAPVSPAEFWAMRSETSGTLREQIRMLSEEEKQVVTQEVQKAVRDFFPNNQMKFPAQMIIVSGEKTDSPFVGL